VATILIFGNRPSASTATQTFEEKQGLAGTWGRASWSGSKRMFAVLLLDRRQAKALLGNLIDLRPTE
jgi:hypothetical protein